MKISVDVPTKQLEAKISEELTSLRKEVARLTKLLESRNKQLAIVNRQLRNPKHLLSSLRNSKEINAVAIAAENLNDKMIAAGLVYE